MLKLALQGKTINIKIRQKSENRDRHTSKDILERRKYWSSKYVCFGAARDYSCACAYHFVGKLWVTLFAPASSKFQCIYSYNFLRKARKVNIIEYAQNIKIQYISKNLEHKNPRYNFVLISTAQSYFQHEKMH